MNFTMTTRKIQLTFLLFIQEHTGAYDCFLRLQEWTDFMQKSRILCAVTGDQWTVPIGQFIQAEKITQKFIHLFAKY